MSARFPTKNGVLAAAILLATLLAYIPAMQGGFIWDDDDYVTENPTLSSVHGLKQIWLNPSSSPQYYPLVFSSFWLEYRLWELRPTGYHVVNVLLHVLSALLLWRLLQCLNVPGAWLAAAVFALHPVQVESVAWVTERKNVLSAFFYLGSMLCLVRFFGLAGKEEDKSSLRWYVFGLLLFSCSLLSKTVTCTLPAAMLLILWWKRGKVQRRELGALAPFFVFGLAMGLATAWLEQHHVGAVGAEWDLSLVERCLIAGRALWFYFGKLIWPWELIFNYPRWQVDAGVWWQYIYPAGVLFVVLLLWLIRDRVGRGPLVGVLFFCGTLFPALGFFDVYPFRYSYVADHFQYLASIGLIALLVGAIATAASKLPEWPQRIIRGSGLMVLILFGVQTWHQGYTYADMETLWTDTLKKNPASWMARNNLGNLLKQQGKIEEAVALYSEALRLKPDFTEAHYNLGNALASQGKLEEAIGYYWEALRIDPYFAQAHNALGYVLANRGRLEEAIDHYSEALRINPNHDKAHYNLGTAFAVQGRFEEAISHYSEALRIKPDSAEIHNNLGVAFVSQGRFEEAIDHYSEALRLKPDFGKAHNNLGNLLATQGRFEEAIDHYYQARRIDPNNPTVHVQLGLAWAGLERADKAIEHYQKALSLSPDATIALNNLAWIMATHKNSSFRDGVRAVQLAEKACTLTGYKNAVSLDTLAAAYAEAGRFDEAFQGAQKAVELAVASRNEGLAKDIEKRMELYLAGKPYRGS